MGALRRSEIEQAWDVGSDPHDTYTIVGEAGGGGKGTAPRLGVRHAAQITDRMHGVRVCSDPSDLLCTEWTDFLPAVYVLRDNVRCHRMGADPPIKGPRCVGWGASARGADASVVEKHDDLWPWRRAGFDSRASYPHGDQLFSSPYPHVPPPPRASWNRSSSTQTSSGTPMYRGNRYLGDMPLGGDPANFRDEGVPEGVELVKGLYDVDSSPSLVMPTSTTMTAHDRMLEENGELLSEGPLGAAPSAEQLRRHSSHCDAVPPTSNDRQMAWSRLCCCYDAGEDPKAVCPFIVCPAGHFSSGEHTCSECSENTFSDSEKGSIECVGPNGCAAGRFPNSTLRACQDCPINTFSPDGMQCRPCPVGSIASEGSHGCNATNVGPGWVLAQPMDSCSTTCARWANEDGAGEEWQADSITCDESVLQSLAYEDVELIGRILHSIVKADGSSKGQRPALQRQGGPNSETQVSRAKLKSILTASDESTSKPSLFSDVVTAPGTQIGHVPDDFEARESEFNRYPGVPMFRESESGNAHQLDPNANIGASPYVLVDEDVTLMHSGRRRPLRNPRKFEQPNKDTNLIDSEGFLPYLGFESRVVDPHADNMDPQEKIHFNHIRAFASQHFAKCDTILSAMGTARFSVEDEMESPHYNQTTWTSVASAFLSSDNSEISERRIRERLLHMAGLTGSKSSSRGGVLRKTLGDNARGDGDEDLVAATPYSRWGNYRRGQGLCTAPHGEAERREFFAEAVNDDSGPSGENVEPNPLFPFLKYSTFQRPPRFTGSTVSRVGHRVCCCAVAGFAHIACPIEGASLCRKGTALNVEEIPSALSDCRACKGDLVSRTAKQVACEQCPPGRKSWTKPSALDDALASSDADKLSGGFVVSADELALQSSCRFTQQERTLVLSSALGFWAFVVASVLPFVMLFIAVCIIPCCSRTCKCNTIHDGDELDGKSSQIPGVYCCALFFFWRSVGLRVRPCCARNSAYAGADDTDVGHDVGCIETALRSQQAAEAHVLTSPDGSLLPLCGKSTDISDSHSGVGLFFHDLARISRVFLVHAVTITVALAVLAATINDQDVDEGCAETPSAWDQTITVRTAQQ
jgi:hypothetical protein